MKPRTYQALFLAACVTSMLGGCATTGTSDSTAKDPSSSQLHSLRIADISRNTPPPAAGATSDSSLNRVELPNAQQPPQAIDLTSETDDLFQRMRNGFSMPDLNNDLVLYHQQWYMNRPDYLRRMVERSGRYMHHIVEELEKRGMPMELALLPMVESAYNPMAYSRSKASGLWQFIPATGKRYNLDQNWWKDDRRDIVASTAAALDYLQSIYEMHGDWQLALASYNWGEGAVGKAINKNRALGLPTDYQSLTMPNETKNYVPKLQALKNIFSNPATLAQLDLPKIPNQPYFATITPSSNIDVKVAAKLADMPVQEFVALNPAHNRPVIKSETPLVIPADKVDTFMSNLEIHELNNKPLSLWQAYTMQRGDKLDKIAARFGMTSTNLKAINGIKARSKLPPGMTLLVTRQKEEISAQEVNELSEQSQAASATNESEPTKQAAKLAEKESPEPAVSSAPRTYTARKGETLTGIAKAHGVSVAELKRLNRLSSDKVRAGMHLTLTAAPTKLAAAPVEKATPAAEAKTAKAGKADKAEKVADKKGKSDGKTADKKEKVATRETPAKGKKAAVARYTVRAGDTLFSIARQFNVDSDDLMRWNHVTPKSLTPGKTLTIQLARNP